MRIGPDSPSWYCCTEWPVRKTALPHAETLVSSGCALADCSRSPMRPPQPDAAPSGASDCQNDCWSLCE